MNHEASTRRRRLGLGLSLALLCTGGVRAGEGAPLEAGARADLQAALQELSRTRAQIEEERLPLVRRLRELEEAVKARREEWDRARRAADNALVELNVVKAEVRARSNEVAAVEGLLHNYFEAFAGRLHAAEAPRYEAALREFQRARSEDVVEPARRLERELALIEVGLERLERLVGGDLWAGRALAAGGELVEGRYVSLGPLVWFAAAGGQGPAGVTQVRLNSPAPEVAEMGGAASAGIQEVADRGHGEVPVDPTRGNALKIAATKDPLWVHIRKGGPVMVPILLLGLGALAVFVVKWIQLSRVPMATPEEVQAVLGALSEGNTERAQRAARQIQGPVGRILEAALLHWREPKEAVEEVLYERMLALRPRWERGLPFLALAAAAAPLLGLLGTVTGMINTFNVITVFGTGDPKTLAGGISEALITTEFGLIVAIPSLLLHALLSRRLKGLLGQLEQISLAFLNGLPEPGTPARVREGVEP